VTTVEKVTALSRDFGSRRRLAELLGVSPAQLTRWRQGQGIDEVNAGRVDLWPSYGLPEVHSGVTDQVAQ